MGSGDARSIRSAWAIAHKGHLTRSLSPFPGESNVQWFRRATKLRLKSIRVQVQVHFAIELKEKGELS